MLPRGTAAFVCPTGSQTARRVMLHSAQRLHVDLDDLSDSEPLDFQVKDAIIMYSMTFSNNA